MAGNYTEDEEKVVEEITDFLHDKLIERGVVQEGHILTGWALAYSTTPGDIDEARAGYLYGPRGVASWTVLGLFEWVKKLIFMSMEEANDDEGDD